MKKIRVLVVDDSLFMRTLISEMLNSYEQIEVIGTAKNGYEAIQKLQILYPDVITLDVEMPIMDGLDTLAYIMSNQPTPVIMLSAVTKRNTRATIKAFEYGAIDFVTKPSGNISLNIKEIEDEFIEKIISASQIDIKKVQITPPPKFSKPLSVVHKIKFPGKIVAIGASTGGPRTITSILTKIPYRINAAIFIVQHMPAGFTQSFAERLNHICSVSVKEAENQDFIHAGMVYIAPGGYHLKIENINNTLKIVLDNKTAPILGVRPSVNYMMKSIVENFNANQIMGIILTGMGKDGAEGLKLIKEMGGQTIAQNKESSVVFGMPSSAISTGHVDKVLSIEEITNELINFIV